MTKFGQSVEVGHTIIANNMRTLILSVLSRGLYILDFETHIYPYFRLSKFSIYSEFGIRNGV